MKKIQHENEGAVIALAGSIREHANLFITQELTKQGITDLLPAHGSVLHALFQRSPLQMNELAACIGRKKNTVTGLISTLEKAGYCRRTPSIKDARVQLVSLTEKGEAMRQVTADISQNLLQLVWQGVDGKERQFCIRCMEKLLHNLKQGLPD